jgi:hypothetical protein
VFTVRGKRIPRNGENKKKKKKNKKLDNVNKVTTFAVPTNREPLNGC